MIISLVYGIVVHSTSYADDRISGLNSAGSNAQVKDIIPHEVGDENYVEKYTFDAQLRQADALEDREWTGRVYYSISVSNIGAGDHNVTARGTIEIGKDRYQWEVKKSGNEWKRAKNKLDVNIGGVRLYGDFNTLHLEAKSKQGEMKVELKPIAKPWRPGGGGFRTTDKKRVEFTLLPMNAFEGSFKLNGQEEVRVKGIGWGTHSWSHLGPHEWSKWTAQTRLFDADKRQAVFIRQIKIGGDYQSGSASYVVFFDGAEQVFEGYGINTNVNKKYTDKNHSNRYTFATDFTISATDIHQPSKKLEAHFKTNKKHYHRNPIAQYSWIKRKVIEAVTKPMIYAYQVDYDLKLSGSGTSAKSGFKGDDGRYEVYFLND